MPPVRRRVPRPLLVALLAGVVVAGAGVPAVASLIITDRQAASIVSIDGPTAHRFGTGNVIAVGGAGGWGAATLDGVVEVDGDLELARAGEVAPTADPWWDTTFPTRSCGPVPDPGAADVQRVSIPLDIDAEIAAGRMAVDGADIRVVDAVAQTELAHTLELGGAGLEAAVPASATTICVYWGDPDATSTALASLELLPSVDGALRWTASPPVVDPRVAPATIDELDTVDWSSPDTTASRNEAAIPPGRCDDCAAQLVGSVEAPTTGSYRFFVSADDVARLELAPGDDQAGLVPVVDLTAATAIDVFDGPDQASDPVDLIAGERYALRARTADGTGSDHLQVAWSIDGGPTAVITGADLIDGDGIAGGVTIETFALPPLVPEPVVVDVAASEIVADSCEGCGHDLSGWVVVPTTGAYRFAVSSADPAALDLSLTGDPADAGPAATVTVGVAPSTWADAEQASAPVDLTAGDVVWVSATTTAAGPTHHLQIGWSLDGAAIDLVDPARLGTTAPVAVPAVVVTPGPIEGRYVAAGQVTTEPVDTSADGSGVPGLGAVVASIVAGSDIDARLEGAADPAGPWTDLGPLAVVTDAVLAPPLPFTAAANRYLRVNATLASDDGEASARLSGITLEHDIDPIAVTADGAASIPVAVGVATPQYLLRFVGPVATSATAELGVRADPPDGVTGQVWFTPSTPEIEVDAGTAGEVGSGVAYDPGGDHVVGVTVTAGTADDVVAVRWQAVDVDGLVVTNDLDLVMG